MNSPKAMIAIFKNLCFVFVLFCSSCNVPENAAHATSPAPISADNKEEVAKWILEMWPVCNWGSLLPRPTPFPDVDGWINRGRNIPNIADILAEFLEKKDERFDPETILYALKELGNSKSVHILITYLKNDYSRCRMKAAIALGNIGDPRAKGPLCETILEDEDLNVRGDAALALGNFKGKLVELCLKDVSANDKSDFVKSLASQSLSKVQNIKIISEKIPATTTKPSEIVDKKE